MGDPPTVMRVDPATPPKPHLFEVSPTLEQNRELDVRPVYISLGLEPSAFPPRLGGFTDPSQSPYALKKGLFDTAVRGTGAFADRIWLFRGDSYLRYFEHANGQDQVTDFLPILGNWHGFPAEFVTGIDAALTGRVAPYDGHIWFFRGSRYLRYDPGADQVVVGSSPIAGNWPGVVDPFAQGIDAAIHGLGSYLGIVWFFKDGEYLRYNLTTDTTERGPAPIIGNWPGWPESFADGIDFAFYGTGRQAEHIYFFRGDQYIRYSLPDDRVEEGPSKIVDNWALMTRFMPTPQLFLVEQYSLRTFHGEMGRGEIIGTPVQVAAGGTTTFYVITKKLESTTQTSSRNILESGSEQAVTSFSDAIRTDDSQTGSQEKYDYGMQASFHGEAQATSIIGGEVDANVQVAGASQDVRSGFAKAVNNQVERQAAETHESHRQQVSAEGEEHQIREETETGFKQVIDNSANPNVANFVLFQLTQEYVVVLSLVDARLAFHNGNSRQAKIVAIRDMDGLLAECLSEPSQRATLASAVVAATTNVVDYAGQVRSLLTAGSSPDAAQVDPAVTSAYELKNSVGERVRDIVVPGIMISVDRPVVLTPNSALAPLEVN